MFCLYFVYINFLCVLWHHSDCIHFGGYYGVSYSDDVWFDGRTFDFVSDDFFEMVSLVVNNDGNGGNLILLDLKFLRLALLISVLWSINDAELLPLIALSVIPFLMWGMTLSIISVLVLLNSKWLWLVSNLFFCRISVLTL